MWLSDLRNMSDKGPKPPSKMHPAKGAAKGDGGTAAAKGGLTTIGPLKEAPLQDTSGPGPGQDEIDKVHIGNSMSRPVLYANFFGLTERPFTLQPDPSFIYWSKQHKRAYSILEFGILSNAPITLITGEIGAGKTTLLRALLDKMDTDVTVGLISNAQGSRGELIQWVLNALGIEMPARETYVRLFQRLQDFIVSEYAAGRRVVLIFDEAQNLTLEGLEELRLLTNINSGKDELVQLILVGQPELKDLVLHPNMRQLTQRITASFHLMPMDLEATGHYITHRLRHAGGSGEEFTPDAVARIFAVTKGIPRLVNQLCEFAMLYAWSENTRSITAQTVQNVLNDGVFFGAHAVATEEKTT